MGWKSIKDHYRIGHIVQVTEKGICIGSPYVHNIIVILPEGPRWGSGLGPSLNDDLSRYFKEMASDLGQLRALIGQPDMFDRSLPVFTYEGGRIIEKECEEYGWPNCTHDGLCMYENLFFERQADAINACKRNAEAAVENARRRVEELQCGLEEATAYLNQKLAENANAQAIK